MEKIAVRSKLTHKEIEKNFADVNFFDGVMAGLKESLAYETGTAQAATFARKKSLPVIDVAEFRKELELTQKGLAEILGVSTRTVEAWESGRNVPTPTAKNLMYLISLDKTLVTKLQN